VFQSIASGTMARPPISAARRRYCSASSIMC
jgi:hypothetical protein